MPRFALFLAVTIALAACDSGDPSVGEADDLQGTWTFSSVTSQEVVTVSTTQSVVDLTQAPTGSLALSGDESGTLRYVNSFYRYGASSTLWLSSFDASGSTYPAVRHVLMLADEAGSQTAHLRMESDVEVREYQATGASLFERSGARYGVDVSLPAYYGGEAAARVAGTFVLGNRTLTAGERNVISQYVSPFDPYNTVRYRFERGGVLKIQEVSGNRTVEREGSWERTGDRLRVTSVEGDATVSYDYRLGREGTMLLLISDRSAYPYSCDAECLRYAEASYGIEPGTLRSVVIEEVLRLEPYSDGRARVQVAGPSAALELPAPLQARVRVAPQPRP